MKALYSWLKTNIISNQKIRKYFTIFFIVIFLTSYAGYAFSKQTISTPVNPMEDGYAENSSQMELISYSGNSHKSEEDDQKENLQQEPNKQVKKKNEQENLQQESKKQVKEIDQQESNTKSTTTQKNQQVLNDNSRNKKSSQDKKDTTDNSGNKDVVDNKGSKQSTDNKKEGNENPNKPEDTEEIDEDDIEIVDPKDEDEELKDNEFFTTTIVDKEIVTKKDFSFVIKQKHHDYEVKELKVTLNNKIEADFSGTVTLISGDNQISITVTYEDKDGKVFEVTKKYTVTLVEDELVIYSSLEKDMEVSKPELIFTASAQKADEVYEVSVSLNGEVLKADSNNKYNASLKVGQNNITISASDDNGETKKQEYTITYNKKESTLSIETDLKDQEVSVSTIDFYAIAKDGENQVNLAIEVNDEPIESNKKGNYSVKLKEGNNKIVLKGYTENDSIIQEYKVAYVKPAGQDESDTEANKNAPILVTDLIDGSTITGSIKTFNVWPVDYKGKRIRGKDVIVSVNGVGVPFVWDDSTKTSYKLNLNDGRNEVVITVTDSEGRTTTETFYIYATALNDGDVIGKATISIEATTVGLGYLIPPTVVEIHQGEKASYILDQILRDNDFTYTFTGTLDNGFYLSAIQKPGLVTNPVIPEDLLELVRDDSSEFDLENYDPDWLGEFDFANGSGWMYSVNGDYPNYGFSDSYLLDGDVVRIRYTLHYGKDIGGYGSMGGGSGGNWPKEW